MKRTITQKNLAKALELHRSTLSELFSGKRRFGPKRSARLEQITGLGLRLWLFGTPEEIRLELEKVYGEISFRRGRPPIKREVKK